MRNVLNFWKLITKSHSSFSFLKLAAVSDVFVENYIPGKLAGMGLGYEDIKKIAPHLVYCSITGILISVTCVHYFLYSNHLVIKSYKSHVIQVYYFVVT